MLQHVNSVLVGAQQGTSTLTSTALSTPGAIVMVDRNGALITNVAGATAADEMKLGLVSSTTQNYTNPADGTIKTINLVQYTNSVKKGDITNYEAFVYSAPFEDVVTISGASAVAVVNYRYVIRIIYRDLYEHPGQFTHTYEQFANTTSISDLFTAFANQINNDPRRRCTASVANSILTLTALPKDDNNGKESINIYTRVNMTAVMYYTNPDAAGFASKNKYVIPNVEIGKVPGSNGKGYNKVVRDREQAALGYRGITFRTWWPIIKPELNVDLTKNYDGAIIEFEPTHATAEDDFRKTKQTIEVYVDNTTALASSMIGQQIAAFCA